MAKGMNIGQEVEECSNYYQNKKKKDTLFIEEYVLRKTYTWFSRYISFILFLFLSLFAIRIFQTIPIFKASHMVLCEIEFGQLQPRDL